MSLKVRSTAIAIYPNSKPQFAIYTTRHPAGGWVIAQNPAKQEEFYNLSKLAKQYGAWIEITYDHYEEYDGDRRFFQGVTVLDAGPRTLGHSEPEGWQRRVECWPALEMDK